MPWPNSTAFSAGQTAGVSSNLNLVRADIAAVNGYLVKTTDEIVSASTTLQNDDHLFYTIASTGTYVGELVLWGTSSVNAGGDIKLGFTYPTGTMDLGGIGQDSSLASGTVGTIQSGVFLAGTSPSSSLVYGLSTSNSMLVVKFRLAATATGTLQLQWAQNTASGTSTLKAGSHMTVKQVA